MNYKTIDLNTWDRGKLFTFYIEKMRVVMSLTVDMDGNPVSRVRKEKRVEILSGNDLGRIKSCECT